MESDQNVFSFMIDGKELLADVEVGEVLEIQSHSETIASGSGGGGSIRTSPNNGVSGWISPIDFSSTTVNKTKLWVKTARSAEDEWIFPFDVTTLSVRNGHKIGRYFVVDVEKRHGWIRKYINFTTNKSLDVTSLESIPDYLDLFRDVKSFPYIFGGFCLGLALGIALRNTVSPELGVIVCLCGLIGGFIASEEKKRRIKKINTAFYNQLVEADRKVMELIASNKIPTAVAYFKAKKEQKS